MVEDFYKDVDWESTKMIPREEIFKQMDVGLLNVMFNRPQIVTVGLCLKR